MKTPHYFTRTVPGATVRRYYLMHATRNAYVSVLVSRPDGTEIREPAGVCDETGRKDDVQVRGHTWNSATAVKRCVTCNSAKPLSDFSNGNGKHGIKNVCRICDRARRLHAGLRV